jgi:hypothetical protein
VNEGWLQLVQDAIKLPGLLVEIYGDLARPGVKQVGKALDTILGLGNTILWPIAWANERSRIALNQNLEKFRKCMEAVPEERVIPIAPEIGVPIAEKLAYVHNNLLSDLYVNLLSKAADMEAVEQAHPSFVNIINNLSPDEAQLLKKFQHSHTAPYLTAKAISDDSLFIVLCTSILSKQWESGLTFPKNIPAYISNLTGLGVITAPSGEFLDDTKIYDEIESAWTEHFLDIIQNHKNLKGRKLVFKKGIIDITSFGEQFIAACNSRDSEQRH